MGEYLYNAGQKRRYEAGEETKVWGRVPFDKAEVIEEAPYEFHPKFADKHFFTASDKAEFVPGVEAKMVDWFWANMEKGYLLWAPGEHHGFDWIVPPCEVGYEGSVEGSYEFDATKPIKITRLGMQHYPYTDCYEHCWLSCFSDDPDDGFLIHMYEDCPGGIKWRTISVSSQKRMEGMKKMMEMAAKMAAEGKPMPPRPDIAGHMEYESGRLKDFLPQLYALWVGHPDPFENMQFDLTTAKNEDGTWRHVHKNLPPQR
ncbi:MAG: hypothetical protein MJ086_02405 [Lachnospiraceae bacterium]|nr:hypothetical protein [Lachnospiraceae bacterium]